MDELAINETRTVLTHLDEDDAGNKTSQVTTMFKYWLDGPIGLSLASTGLVLNMMAIAMLARQRVQRTFHMLMIYLSCWDFAYLVLSIICFALPMMSASFRDQVFIYWVPYAIPLAQICLLGSCYSTVALTVERYIAVCAPFFRLRHNIKARFYILPILLFAPLYNLPRFFEFRTVTNATYHCVDRFVINRTAPTGFQLYDNGDVADYVEDEAEKAVASGKNYSDFESYQQPQAMVEEISDIPVLTSLDSGNATQYGCTHWNKRTVVDLVITDFRKNPTYVSVYVNYVNLIVNLIIPTIVLGVLNCMIYRALQKSMTSNSIRRNRGGENSEEALRKRDIRLTRVAIIIVCIFIICHLPRFIPNVVEMFLSQLPESFNVVISFNNLLQIVNCTVNYIIYFGHSWKLKRADKKAARTQFTSQADKIEICVTAAETNNHDQEGLMVTTTTV